MSTHRKLLSPIPLKIASFQICPNAPNLNDDDFHGKSHIQLASETFKDLHGIKGIIS